MKVLTWLAANQDLLLLILAALLPHIMAILPAKLRTSRVRHVVKFLDLLAGNWMNARNAPPKKTVQELLDKQKK